MRQGPWSDAGFPAVLTLVEERAGLAPPSCPASAEEGITRAMARAGLTDFDEYRARISSDPAAMDDLLTELTIGETYFFRTPEHFEYLRRVVLPGLREQHGAEYNARLWSAACSSGEEPYSLAALLMNEGWSDHSTVFASDVSRTALARARRAHYGEWSLRGPWAERMRAYLRAEGRQYALSPDVKERVRFTYLNLALDTWPSPDSGIWKLDVIFCRNVLIYFNGATIEGVARRLHAALNEGGYLFTGPSDPPLGGLAPLEPVLTDWGVLYRRLTATASVAVPVTAPFGAVSSRPRSTTGSDAWTAALGGAEASLGTGTAPPVARPGLAGGTSASDGTHGGGAPGSPTSSGGLGARAPGTAPGAGARAPGTAPGGGAPGARAPGTAPGAGARAPGMAPGAGPRAPGMAPGAGTRAPGMAPGVGTQRDTGGLPAPSAPSTREPGVAEREAARRALERGDWREAATRMGALDADADIATTAVREIANLDAQAAIYACVEAASRHPLVPGLRYLEALLLLGQGRITDAERSVRQALYLEPTLAVAWLVLGRVLRRLGDTAGALKALREAEALCAALPPDAPLPLAEGERARELASAAREERIRLENTLTEGGVP